MPEKKFSLESDPASTVTMGGAVVNKFKPEKIVKRRKRPKKPKELKFHEYKPPKSRDTNSSNTPSPSHDISQQPTIANASASLVVIEDEEDEEDTNASDDVVEISNPKALRPSRREQLNSIPQNATMISSAPHYYPFSASHSSSSNSSNNTYYPVAPLESNNLNYSHSMLRPSSYGNLSEYSQEGEHFNSNNIQYQSPYGLQHQQQQTMLPPLQHETTPFSQPPLPDSTNVFVASSFTPFEEPPRAPPPGTELVSSSSSVSSVSNILDEFADTLMNNEGLTRNRNSTIPTTYEEGQLPSISHILATAEAKARRDAKR